MKVNSTRDILYVMAAEQEYGPHLRGRISPLITGIGPIEAAISLTRELCFLRGISKAHLPKVIVSLGSAGSRKLEKTEVYQVSSVFYRDMDATALGFERGATPLVSTTPTETLPYTIPGIPSASLSTGAAVISGSDYDTISEDMVDMETYAHFRTAESFEIPLIGLRGISDGDEDLQHIDDWTKNLKTTDRKLATAVDLLEDLLLKTTSQPKLFQPPLQEATSTRTPE